MPTYRAVGFLRHCCPWGQVRYNASATDLAARSIATQTRCFGKLQATAGNLAVVLFLGYGSPRQARLSDEATRHAPPSAARPDSSRPRTAGAIQPPECARSACAGGRFRSTLHYHPVVRVTLTDTEVRICRWLAAQRFAAARKAGVQDAQMGPQSSEQTDLDGIAGEFAFCKVANVWPDMTIGARRGGHDAFLNGMSVDVKTTRCPTGHLLATIKKSTTASDVYVLVIGTVPEFRIAGWASAAQLLHPENIADFGHGSGYALSQRQLQPISALVDNDRISAHM